MTKKKLASERLPNAKWPEISLLLKILLLMNGDFRTSEVSHPSTLIMTREKKISFREKKLQSVQNWK